MHDLHCALQLSMLDGRSQDSNTSLLSLSLSASLTIAMPLPSPPLTAANVRLTADRGFWEPLGAERSAACAGEGGGGGAEEMQ